MKCDWWPPDQKRPCQKRATYKMVDGLIFLARLCLPHKKEASMRAAWSHMTFKKICGGEYECDSDRTYADLCEEERICMDCEGSP